MGLEQVVHRRINNLPRITRPFLLAGLITAGAIGSGVVYVVGRAADEQPPNLSTVTISDQECSRLKFIAKQNFPEANIEEGYCVASNNADPLLVVPKGKQRLNARLTPPVQ